MKLLVGTIALALTLPLSCGEEDDVGACPPPAYARCGTPLDATGQGTYTDALSEAASACEYAVVFRGSCADGKTFLAFQFGLGSSASYYRDEKLVGTVSSNDLIDCSSPCPLTAFSGTLETVRCDAPEWEVLCQQEDIAQAPSPALPFADGLPGPTCEALCETGKLPGEP